MRMPAALIAASLLGGCGQEYDLIAPDPEIPKAPAPAAAPPAGAEPSGEAPQAPISETEVDTPEEEDGATDPLPEDTGSGPEVEEEPPADPTPPDDPPVGIDTGEEPPADDPPLPVDTGSDLPPGDPPPEEPAPGDTDVEEPPPPPPPPPAPRACETALPLSWSTLSFPGGRESQFSYVGDIDRDGIDDAVWVNQLDGNASVYWSGSILTGGAPTNYAIGRSEGYVSWGDLDNDGLVDLVASNQDSGRVRILRSTSMRSYPSSSPLNVEGFPQSVLVDDLDLDGRPDLIVGLGHHSKLVSIRSLGGGAWAAPVDFSLGSWHTVSPADLDGDGINEYIQSYSGGLISHGGGAPFSFIPRPSGGDVWGLWPYDSDGDGAEEIVAQVSVPGAGSHLEIWTWDPVDGPQLCGVSGPVPTAGIGRVTGMGDIDGDGVIDLTGQSTCSFCSSTYHVILGGE